MSQNYYASIIPGMIWSPLALIFSTFRIIGTIFDVVIKSIIIVCIERILGRNSENYRTEYQAYLLVLMIVYYPYSYNCVKPRLITDLYKLLAAGRGEQMGDFCIRLVGRVNT